MRRDTVGIGVLLSLCLLSAVPAFSGPLQTAALTPGQDKAFSEFNHHLSGAFLLSIGVMAFLSNASARLAFLKRIWPFLFILPGIYLAFMSDPDVWPMGGQSWFEAFRTNTEATEHKAYSLLLIAIGVIEFQRGRGRLNKTLAAWAFPALAFIGAALLLFHRHGGGEHSTHAMHGMDMGSARDMMKIHKEHLAFSIVGAGIAVFKFVADYGALKNRAIPLIWPVLMSVLGILLMLYSE